MARPRRSRHASVSRFGAALAALALLTTTAATAAADPAAAAGVSADPGAVSTPVAGDRGPLADASSAQLEVQEAPREAGPGCTELLDEVVAGDEAVRLLGRDLAEVARRNGREVAALRRTLREDDSLHVDRCGRLFYVDPVHDHHLAPDDHDHDHGHTDDHAHGERSAADPTPGPTLAHAPIAPLAETFALQSRPGSKRTIYLDFDGHTLTGTAWNDSLDVPSSLALPPFDIDGDHGSFSNAELALIQDVWQRVAEDFAPFDVNVTTEDPGQAAITRTNAADQVYGTRAVITDHHPNAAAGFFCFSCAGVAYIGVFDAPDGHAFYQPALIFSSAIAPDAQAIADTVSHEVGHNFGLDHHGQGWSEYASGQGLWFPIMGSGSRPLSTWSNGDYGSATRPDQDDVATIAGAGAPLLGDDHGDTAGTATVIGASPVSVSGVIERRTDVDWFRFTASGPTTIRARPADVGPNLDLRLEVVTSDGAVLADVDPPANWAGIDDPWSWYGEPATGLDAEVTLDLAAGTYHARVRGVGSGSPADTGYSDYGSLGRYILGIAPQGTEPPPPGEAPVVTVTGGPAAVTNATTATFTFVSNPAGAAFECRLDAGAWQACTSPRALSGLSHGEHTFAVRGTLAGLTSPPATHVWRVDTRAPVVTIQGGPAEGSSTTSRRAQFTFAADEPTQGFECRLNQSGAWQGCGQGITIDGLSPGAWRLDVRARDLVGNLGSATRRWTVTSTAPPPPPPSSPPPSSPPPSSGGVRFSDVPSSSPHAANIAKLAARGVTLGCGGDRYCPDAAVNREQMATFIVRATGAAPGSTSPPFRDVKAGSTHARSIDAMRRDGVTLGCGNGNYCPSQAVLRDQMASFLQRAMALPPGSASPPFRDVRANSTHARAIDAMRRESITLGCGGGNYCPGVSVTRAQMASFLVRAFGW